MDENIFKKYKCVFIKVAHEDLQKCITWQVKNLGRINKSGIKHVLILVFPQGNFIAC
jgi:hypothetical protein